jgi:hypothetical protein
MLAALTKGEINTVHWRYAPFRVPQVFLAPKVGHVSVSVGHQAFLCVRQSRFKESTRLQDSQAFRKKRRHLTWVPQVLEKMFAVDVFNGIILPGEWPPQIKVIIRCVAQEIDIDPPGPA